MAVTTASFTTINASTATFDDAGLPGEMTTTVLLTPVSCRTDVAITQEGIPAMIPPEACYLGWQESLDQLAALVEPEAAINPATGRQQDPGAQAVVPLLEIEPGMLVLDICAAPGNKTAQIAAAGARVVACDRYQIGRARV